MVDYSILDCSTLYYIVLSRDQRELDDAAARARHEAESALSLINSTITITSIITVSIIVMYACYDCCYSLL